MNQDVWSDFKDEDNWNISYNGFFNNSDSLYSSESGTIISSSISFMMGASICGVNSVGDIGPISVNENGSIGGFATTSGSARLSTSDNIITTNKIN